MRVRLGRLPVRFEARVLRARREGVLPGEVAMDPVVLARRAVSAGRSVRHAARVSVAHEPREALAEPRIDPLDPAGPSVPVADLMQRIAPDARLVLPVAMSARPRGQAVLDDAHVSDDGLLHGVLEEIELEADERAAEGLRVHARRTRERMDWYFFASVRVAGAAHSSTARRS